MLDQYSFFNEIVLRTPLLPFRQNLEKSDIQELIEEPQIQEAIFLASPSLYTRMNEWRKGTLKEDKVEGLVEALYKYLMRMHTRCTPFGLFAGCSVGEWADDTSIKLNKKSAIHRHTRLDMNYLCALSQYLEKQPEIRQYLKYNLNSSIHKKDHLLHYIEYFYQKNSRTHRVNSVELDSYLNVVLDKAKDGCYLKELVQVLLYFDDEIKWEEAEAYVNAIIESQILVSELEPSLTGDGMLNQIINIVKPISERCENLVELVDLLVEIKEIIFEIDAEIINADSSYKRVVGLIEKIGVEYDVSKLFQTDIYKKGEVQLNKKIQFQLKKCMRFLQRFPASEENPELIKFINTFYARYEDREVNLLDVLDTQWGIGYPVNTSTGDTNPLTKDIALPVRRSTQTEVKWNEYEEFIFNTILENNNNDPIDLSLKDTKVFDVESSDKRPFSDTLYTMFKLLNEDEIFLEFASGSSGINLISRFGYGDEKIKGIIENVVSYENKCLGENTINAEIIHLPEARTGNILSHPDCRGFEIPYLGKSSKSGKFQIPLNDIYISVDPMSRQIFLRSKKLRKRIIPKLSNAHNYTFRSLPVYHFLCDMQLNNKKESVLLRLGEFHRKFKFVPRIKWKNIVLRPATWFLSKKDYMDITPAQVDEFKSKHNLPDTLLLIQGDNQLYFNLSNALATSVFFKEIKKRPFITISEFLTTSPKVGDKDSEIYANEFIAFLKNDKPQPVRFTAKEIDFPYPKDLFIGSQWLYYKIYSGISTSDYIISNVIKTAVGFFLEKGWIDKWFFIRFNDPDNHVRFRIKIKNPKYLSLITKYLHEKLQPLAKQDIISKIQTDTYKPEIDRYGIETLSEAEEWFMYDSEATAEMLSLIGGEKGESVRWLYALRAVDELLDNFDFTLKNKKELLVKLKTAFAKEFNSNKFLRKQLNLKYKNQKASIFQVLDRAKDKGSSLSPLFDVLLEQRLKSTECIRLIKQKTKSPLDYLLSDFIHMLLNRIFKTEQRKCEMVVYDFMCQYYTTQLILIEKASKNMTYEVSKL